MSINTAIYEDIARLGDNISEQDRIGMEQVREGWAKIIHFCMEKDIPFTRYLSDSPMIMDFLCHECCEAGKMSLLVAPCDSGKTKAMLEEFATALSGTRSLIITTPITLQSEQNARMYSSKGKNDIVLKTISVTGASDESFDLSVPNAYSTVYDSASRLERLSGMELSRIVLVVDEAHQLFTAKSYRGAAINRLWKLIHMIINAGGSVIFMTGTPSKIIGLSFDYRATCVRAEFNKTRTSTSLFTPVHEHNFSRIDVIRKDSHAFNMMQLTTDTLMQMIQNGETPLVRVNDKNMIAQIAHTIHMLGKTVVTLSADDKGCRIIQTDEGLNFHYDSKTYESIMNTGLLPKSDCYICTSLLEVGTSIKGVVDQFGNISQPKTLVPVFVCLHPTDCDTDSMEQFFARPRFKFHRAMILMTTPKEREYSSERMDIKRIAGSVWAAAQNNADILNRSLGYGHDTLTRMNGRDEMELLTCEKGKYAVDFNSVIARSYEIFDVLISMFPGETTQMLESRFCVPVSQKIVTGTAPYNYNKVRELPKALTDEIKRIQNGEGSVSMGTLKDIIMNPVGGQFSANALEVLRKCGKESDNAEDESIGMSYIRILQQFLGCSIYPLEVAMDLAAQKLSNPHKKPVHPVTNEKVDFKLDSQHGMFSIMSHFTEVQQDYFIDAYDIWHNADTARTSMYDKSNPLFLFPSEEHFCLAANMDSPMLKDFMSLFKRHRRSLNWRQVCLGAMLMCEEAFHSYVVSAQQLSFR